MKIPALYKDLLTTLYCVTIFLSIIQQVKKEKRTGFPVRASALIHSFNCTDFNVISFSEKH